MSTPFRPSQQLDVPQESDQIHEGTNRDFSDHLKFLGQLNQKGGPDPDDYYELNAWISEIAELSRLGRLPLEVKSQFITCLGGAAKITNQFLETAFSQSSHRIRGRNI